MENEIYETAVLWYDTLSSNELKLFGFSGITKPSTADLLHSYMVNTKQTTILRKGFSFVEGAVVFNHSIAIGFNISNNSDPQNIGDSNIYVDGIMYEFAGICEKSNDFDAVLEYAPEEHTFISHWWDSMSVKNKRYRIQQHMIDIGKETGQGFDFIGAVSRFEIWELYFKEYPVNQWRKHYQPTFETKCIGSLYEFQNALDWWDKMHIVDKMHLTNQYLTRDDVVNMTKSEIQTIYKNYAPNVKLSVLGRESKSGQYQVKIVDLSNIEKGIPDTPAEGFCFGKNWTKNSNGINQKKAVAGEVLADFHNFCIAKYNDFKPDHMQEYLESL